VARRYPPRSPGRPGSPKRKKAAPEGRPRPDVGICRAYLRRARRAPALAYHSLGRKKESDANLAELIGKYQPAAPFQIAEVYAFCGETDRAFQWLERAYTTLDPLLKGLARDPRYAALLRKMRLPAVLTLSPAQ